LPLVEGTLRSSRSSTNGRGGSAWRESFCPARLCLGGIEDVRAPSNAKPDEKIELSGGRARVTERLEN